MNKLLGGVFAAGLAMVAGAAFAQDKPLIGIVSISATEANNARYIQGATKAAEELGYQVSVIDAAGSADQANAGIQNFAQLGAFAIVDMVFPWSSIGAGLDAASAAGIPVVTLGRRSRRDGRRDQRLGRADGDPGRRADGREDGRQGLAAGADLPHRRGLP